VPDHEGKKQWECDSDYSNLSCKFIALSFYVN